MASGTAMDSASLRTASEYLNNLLLARGLLRNGVAIDFVRPSKDSRAQIINLVHDLVLRSDRDKEQREKTATAYRQIRSEFDGRAQEIDRLQVKQDEASRATVQAQTAERTAKEEVKRVEKSARALQEQVTKLKTTLSQVKAQCTTDVKRRDLELARLQTHIQGQQRGNRSVTVAPSITITGRDRKPVFDASIHNVQSPEYTLRQETNAFLTRLSQGLSEENDQLLGMVRGCVTRLQDLLGFKHGLQRASDSGIGEDTAQNKQIDGSQAAFTQLAAELEETLGQVHNLLTNPNFVSIEEVEIREEEILRMRADWDKMEQRWRDLVKMMNSWRKRMDTGGNIDMSDLRKGMGLVSPDSDGNTMPSRPRSQHALSPVDHSAGVAAESQSMSTPGIASGNASPKRKRDPLEPPESFDLRPREHKSKVFRHDDEVQSISKKWMRELDSDSESEELEVPRLTVEEKLSAAAQEAAAVREMDNDSESRQKVDHAGETDARDHDTLGKMQVKKTRITGRPKRRKSTLSRDELADLLLVDE